MNKYTRSVLNFKNIAQYVSMKGRAKLGLVLTGTHHASSQFTLQFTKHCTHISSTDKLFGLQKAFGEITYLSFHKDAISVWGVMGATNLIV